MSAPKISAQQQQQQQMQLIQGNGQGFSAVKKKSSLNQQIAVNRKKKGVQWKEEFEVHEVENWKEFNVLNGDDDKTSCHCSVY